MQMNPLSKLFIVLQALLGLAAAAQAGNIYYYPTPYTSRISSAQTVSVSAYDSSGQLVANSAGNVSFTGSGPVFSGQLTSLTVPAAGQYSFSFQTGSPLVRYWTNLYTLTGSGTYMIQGSFQSPESFTRTEAPAVTPVYFN